MSLELKHKKVVYPWLFLHLFLVIFILVIFTYFIAPNFEERVKY